MPKNTDLAWFGGGLVGGLLLGKLARHKIVVNDDRPIIVVSGGSLHADHAEKWKHRDTPSNPKRWTTKQDNGKKVRLYIVDIASPNRFPTFAAETVQIKYLDGRNQIQTFTFSREGARLEPLLEATDGLELDAQDDRRLNYNDTGGRITSLKLDDRFEVATFNQEEQVKVLLYMTDFERT